MQLYFKVRHEYQPLLEKVHSSEALGLQNELRLGSVLVILRSELTISDRMRIEDKQENEGLCQADSSMSQFALKVQRRWYGHIIPANVLYS